MYFQSDQPFIDIFLLCPLQRRIFVLYVQSFQILAWFCRRCNNTATCFVCFFCVRCYLEHIYMSSGSSTWWYGRIANRQRSTDVAILSGRKPTES